MSRLGWLCWLIVAVSCGRRDFNDKMDAPPNDSIACAEPPAGCVNPTVYVCGGTCFAHCTQPVTRPTAAAACAEWGGCLAVAKNQSANDCAASQLMGGVGWIGLLQQSTANTLSDNWEWCDGTPFTYLAWTFNQPDDGERFENGGENCALIHADGTWTDDGCAQPAPFVCSR